MAARWNGEELAIVRPEVLIVPREPVLPRPASTWQDSLPITFVASRTRRRRLDVSDGSGLVLAMTPAEAAGFAVAIAYRLP
jgi:hypothetical protein